MAKRRRYGDAWKDVQIDAEQNDAVFDRFFKKTQHEPEVPAVRQEEEALPSGRGADLAPPQAKTVPASSSSPTKRAEQKASVQRITPATLKVSTDIAEAARVDGIKRQFRLSKGEASVLKYLLDKAAETGELECYAKIPQLAEVCGMTHRGCQFALRNLETRGFIVRLKEYDPADRLGIQFRITLPA